MKINTILVVALSISALIYSCGDEVEESSIEKISTDTTTQVEELASKELSNLLDDISVAELAVALDSNFSGVLLDVRTAEEYNSGSIDQAVNIDYLADSFSTTVDALDKSIPVYVFCKSGGRSSSASQILHEKGFKEVHNLLGGYTAWSLSISK